MPTYEFRCPEGHDFEKFYRTISSAESQSACPECGKLAERVMSRSGFAFKGSGFYLTDYGKNAHRTSGPEAKPSEGGSKESPAASSADTKPATGGDSSAAKSEAKPVAPPAKPSSSE